MIARRSFMALGAAGVLGMAVAACTTDVKTESNVDTAYGRKLDRLLVSVDLSYRHSSGLVMDKEATYLKIDEVVDSLRTAFAPTLLTACKSGPNVVATRPTDAPETDRVTRLLVWLPPSSKYLDSDNLASALSARLVAQGVQVETVISRPLELERSDSQAPFIARFRPTHRLEIDVKDVSSSGSAAGQLTMFSVVAVLYPATGAKEIRRVHIVASKFIARSADSARETTDQLLDQLQATGITFGR